MTGSPVVVRLGSAYPEAVIDRLASDIASTGLPARIEPLETSSGTGDAAGRIAVEVTGPTTEALQSPALRSTWDTLVDAAQRRHRRQLAAGEVRDVAVSLLLPGDVRIVVTAEAGTGQTDPLLAAVVRGTASGTLTSGDWEWNPTARRLDRRNDLSI